MTLFFARITAERIMKFMSFLKKKKTEENAVRLPVDKILPNPDQPRKFFDPEALSALASSIRRYGLLQPISVRKTEKGYELIAGERRLRAAVLAGLHEIPALVYQVEGEASAELALMENLLREDLNMFETAAAMAKLVEEYALTQEAIAERLSVSQSYVANKLRLLRFHGAVRTRILSANLTERHARALLRLPEGLWEKALDRIEKNSLNVASAEKLVEEMLADSNEKKEKRPRAKMRGALRDIRLFYNSVDRAMAMVRRCGVPVESRREEGEREIRLIISISKESKREA